MTRKQFYADLAKTSEELDIKWEIDGDSIRGYDNYGMEFCPITSVGALYGLKNQFDEYYTPGMAPCVASKLKLRADNDIIVAADDDHQGYIDTYHDDYCYKLSNYKLWQGIRRKLLKAVGLEHFGGN